MGLKDFQGLKSSPPPELSLVAFKDDFCVTFLLTNFVWRSHCTPWLEKAVEGKLGDLPKDASHALSKTNFGSSFRLNEVTLAGAKDYGQAVKTLGSRISALGGPDFETLIIPVLLLTIHAVSLNDLWLIGLNANILQCSVFAS